MDVARLTDAERLRRVGGAGRDHDRGETDQRMEGRNELRHVRHLDVASEPGADAAADADGNEAEDPRRDIGRRPQGERRQDREAHAEHAEPIALARRRRRGESAQRENEEDARD